jgi:hypothetical protein
MVKGLENHNIPHTFTKRETWDDKNKDLNKVETVEIGFVTRLHTLY